MSRGQAVQDTFVPGREDYANTVSRYGLGVQATPGVDERQLDLQEVRSFRSAAARCNYLAADRPNIVFATKELCRAMYNPTEESVHI